MALSEVLNYGAVVASALFAGLSWWSSRREARERIILQLPTVECRMEWEASPEIGQYLSVVFDIENKYDESVFIEAVIIKRPRGVTISSADQGETGADGRFVVTLTAGDSNHIKMYRKIERAGASSSDVFQRFQTIATDRNWIRTCVSGMEDKSTNLITFSVRFSRAGFASSGRQKTLTKTCFVPKRPLARV